MRQLMTAEEKRVSHLKAVQRYNKRAYCRFTVYIRPAVMNRINRYCEYADISKAEFIRQAIEELD